MPSPPSFDKRSDRSTSGRLPEQEVDYLNVTPKPMSMIRRNITFGK